MKTLKTGTGVATECRVQRRRAGIRRSTVWLDWAPMVLLGAIIALSGALSVISSLPARTMSVQTHSPASYSKTAQATEHQTAGRAAARPSS